MKIFQHLKNYFLDIIWTPLVGIITVISSIEWVLNSFWDIGLRPLDIPILLILTAIVFIIQNIAIYIKHKTQIKLSITSHQQEIASINVAHQQKVIALSVEPEILIPELKLELYWKDPKRKFSPSSINIGPAGSGRAVGPLTYRFGLMLINATPDLIASNIEIKVDIYWEGESLSNQIRFNNSNAQWTVQNQYLNNDSPATIVCQSPNLTIFATNITWENVVKFSLPQNTKANLRMVYQITSQNPKSNNPGEIKLQHT